MTEAPQRDDGWAGVGDTAPLSNCVDTWREHVGFEKAETDVGRIADVLLEALAANDASRDGVSGPLEVVAVQGRVGAAWDAAEELHLALDRALESGAISNREARRCRRRLARLQSRLHRAGLRARLSARRELLRDITHDLRVPLNSIVFLTDSLFDERHGELSEAQQQKLGGVYSASTTLLNFVNDLLDLSRSTEEDFECNRVPFSIKGVLEDGRHLVGPVADYYGAEVEFDLQTDDSWYGDPRLVRRILLNLVTNGLEASGEGGTVEVIVDDGGGRDHGSLRIVVSDDGPGIDLERTEALLDPGDPEEWRGLLDGTDGLGLLITGRLVRAAGGSVDVARTGDGGTRFEVDLPFGDGGDEGPDAPRA